MMNLFMVVFSIAALGTVYAAFNYFKVKSLDEGTQEMSEIARAIREGANAFLAKEYQVLLVTVVIVALLMGAFIQLSSAVSFLIGVMVSGMAGFVGMKASTYANVRVTNQARITKNIGKTLKVALRGGGVMGISVSAFALMGIITVFAFFREQLYNLGTVVNWCGIAFEPFSMSLFSFALGCSIVALFNRVGGGIYTKGSDMGADQVGKTEENIPEDDPRNPAVIADNVGDNVGDTAGLGSDLLESYVGAIVSSITLIIYLFNRYKANGLEFSESVFRKLYMYPILFCGLGLLACLIGLIFIFTKKDGTDPHKELNMATWLSAGLTALFNVLMTIVMFKDESFGDLPFLFGGMSPFFSALAGIISGIAIGAVAEYYTSFEYSPTKKLAASCKEGPAIVITQGMSVGMKSTLMSSIILGVALMIANAISGTYGVAMAAVGMLSFVTVTVSVDTYGPISDNAGGIAEMCGLGRAVRAITDKLDSVGNTTAAIGKGFAIGAATFTTVSFMISYICTFTPIEEEITLNVMNLQIFAGILIGGALTWYFSGQLVDAVSTCADKMVDEVRRQFREIVGLREGKARPDYKQCVSIATEGALKEMKAPVLMSILAILLSGFIMGPKFVAGFLLGATLSAILLAIFCGNSGGAWDNSKKSIEEIGRKGLAEHMAAVVGDTVGDPLKDTVGPSLDILIKIMSTVSLIMVSFFSKFNLLELIKSLIG